VPGVGVGSDETGHLDVDAGLFAHLADDGVGDARARVVAAARERPQVVVHFVDEEHTALIVTDHAGN
jgi:hypothetical protein